MKFFVFILLPFMLLANSSFPVNPLRNKDEIKNFCKDLEYQDTSNVGLPLGSLMKLLREADPHKQQIICPNCRNWSWLLITFPHELIRRDALYWGLLRSGNQRDVHNLTEIEKNLNYNLNTYKIENKIGDDYLLRAKSIVQQYFNISNNTSDSNSIGSLLPKLKKMVGPYCLLNHPLELKRCKNAFAYIFKYGIPKYELFYPDLMQEVLLNEKIYYDPLRRVSLKLIQYLKDYNKKVEGDLFSELVFEFKQDGHSQIKSIEYSLKVLGVLAIAGGETGNRLRHVLGTYEERENPRNRWYFPSRRKRYALSLSFNLISMIPQMLDIRALSQGRSLYSVPKGYDLDCQNGKTYYFWMSAYMSWKLIQRDRKISKRLALKVPLMIQNSYQLLGNNDGRKRYKSLTVPTFNLFNNKIRRDVLHSTAGVNFGYHLAKYKTVDIPKLDLNSQFFKFFQRAEKFQNLKPLSKVKELGLKEMDHYEKVISPYFICSSN